MTPYYRRFQVSAPGAEPAPNIAIYRDFFVPRGYALVVMDVRGSGASFGRRDAFRSPTERGDYLALAQWIAQQPWCNGSIGATGISYLGAASCFLGSTGHPAVKAIAPLFAVSDTYSDHVFPGGIACKTVTAHYDDLIRALDWDRRDALKAYAYFSDPRYAGPAPVDDDPQGALVRQAIEEHQDSFLLRDMAPEMAFREEGSLHDPALHSGACSPYWYLKEVAGKVAVYSVSGWYDGSAFVHGSVSRFLTLRGPHDRLLLGPWDHGARTNGSPWRTPGASAPQFSILSEVLRFFDHHLAGLDTGLQAEQPVHYLHPCRGMARQRPVAAGRRAHAVAPAAGRRAAPAGAAGGADRPVPDPVRRVQRAPHALRAAGRAGHRGLLPGLGRARGADVLLSLRPAAARHGAGGAPAAGAERGLQRGRRGPVRLPVRAGRGRQSGLHHRRLPAPGPPRHARGARALPHRVALPRLRAPARGAWCPGSWKPCRSRCCPSAGGSRPAAA